MEYDTKTAPYKTSDRTSFAYVSARDRWPVIVTGAIDDVHRATTKRKEKEEQEEGKRIVENLAKLKYELQHDRLLTPLPDDGQPDIAAYNEELQVLGPPKWFDVPWLYAECYLYRRISTFFALSHHWQTHDVFSRQKISTFQSSRPAVLELAAKYQALASQLDRDATTTAPPARSPAELAEAEKLVFIEMAEICLWGNATDLSLLTSLTYADIQKLQGSSARKASEKNILANDLPAAYEVLRAARHRKQPDRRVDIALDNAGFELFVDLILAAYLLSADLATTVVLHPKSIPWFVSDVVPADFAALLGALADPQAFYAAADEGDEGGKASEPLSPDELEVLGFLFRHLAALHAEGRLVLRPNRFWTQAGSYWRLPSSAPDLYADLKEAELVIFKGDLHYRKLVGDAQWPATTLFATALGPLGPESGIRTLALRTCKADVVVGLEEGVDERLRSQDDGDGAARKWAWSGKWAVVQFCDGKAKK